VVKEVCHNDYPIRVKVVMSKAGKDVQLFDQDQRNLFGKNAARRQTAIKEIESAVGKAK